MTVKMFRDALHSIMGERMVFINGRRECWVYVHAYLAGIFECICQDSALEDFELVQLELEHDYIWNHFKNWFEKGLDIRAEINSLGWNDRKNENEWWYALHG